MEADELLRQGRLAEALQAVQEQVPEDPSNAKLRVFLFQLLAVTGEWDRAMTQLNVAAELDAANLLMAQVCRSALNCEALRAEIFAGSRVPLIFGEPDEWVGWLVQAGRHAAEAKYEESRKLREQAFEAAPTVAGTIDGEAFEWIADADMRLGPVLETVVEGRYYWTPFTAIRSIRIDPPGDLRDLVWLPAQFTWANGGEAVGLIPARYPGSEASDDADVRLARKTEWLEPGGGLYVGLGQRMLATDAGEYPLLEVREIELQSDGAEPQSDGAEPQSDGGQV